MKINMRTISQALNLGQKVYREWNKYQKKKNGQQNSPRTSEPQAGRDAGARSNGQGDFGALGTQAEQQRPAETARPAPPSNPYASGSPYGEAQPSSDSGSWQNGGYPGDYFGSVAFDYSPALDGDADPGEIVWAWVPFEEDYSQGKDRPVLIVGRSDSYLLGLMLTSKDHTEGRGADSNYLDIGSGVWDKEGRDSEVKLDRVIQLNPGGIRREGAVMDRAIFDAIAQAFQQR